MYLWSVLKSADWRWGRYDDVMSFVCTACVVNTKRGGAEVKAFGGVLQRLNSCG